MTPSAGHQADSSRSQFSAYEPQIHCSEYTLQLNTVLHAYKLLVNNTNIHICLCTYQKYTHFSVYKSQIHPFHCVHTTNKHILCAYKPVVCLHTTYTYIYHCVHMPLFCLHAGNTHISLSTHANLSMYTLCTPAPRLAFWHPSCKLCRNWLHHWRDTPCLSVSVNSVCSCKSYALLSIKPAKSFRH